jgi:hypothetical protein
MQGERRFANHDNGHDRRCGELGQMHVDEPTSGSALGRGHRSGHYDLCLLGHDQHRHASVRQDRRCLTPQE